jgi:hypothetical protein
VGRYSPSCLHLVVWVGLSPTYNLCDNTPLTRKHVTILDWLQCGSLHSMYECGGYNKEILKSLNIMLTNDGIHATKCYYTSHLNIKCVNQHVICGESHTLYPQYVTYSIESYHIIYVGYITIHSPQYLIYSMESYHIVYVGYITIHIAHNTLYIVWNHIS